MGLLDLLGSPLADMAAAPQRAPARQPQATAQGAGDVIDEQMMGLGRAFSNFKDPWVRELVKGSVEGRLSRALGYRVELPSEEDTQLKRMLAERTMLEVGEALAVKRTAFARAMLIDMDDGAKRQLGFSGMDDPLAQDPDRALMVLQKMGVPLTRGDLSMSKQEILTTAEANRKQEAATLEAQAKEGRERKSLIETDEFMGKTVDAAAQGEGPIGQEFERTIEGISKARGADLDATPFFWMRDTDSDEPQGSAAYIDIIRANRAGPIGTKLGRPQQAALFTGKFGADLADQIEGLGTDSMGRLLATSSDAGIEPEAAFNLQTAIRMLADDMGMAPADFMKQMLGLEYTGLDDQSYLAVLTQMAGGDPAKITKFLTDNGIRIEKSAP
jgi:hypothetical protein